MEENERIQNQDDESYVSSISKEIDIEAIGGPHRLSREELKKIKKDMKDPTKKPKPRYRAGETVYLLKDVEKNGYTIPQFSLCWIEEILIRLEKNEKGENVYKIHYFLLYDHVNDELLFDDRHANEPDNFFDTKEEKFGDEYDFTPPPDDGYIMFSVRETDVSDSMNTDT